MTKLLEIKSITKKFYGHPIIKDLSFDLSRGQIMSIIGPSGSGKSTILRILSGLEQPTDGSILMNGKEITAIKANKRNISLVFQDSLLFPHMTIEENVSYGGKLAKKRIKMKQFNYWKLWVWRNIKDIILLKYRVDSNSV